jgi:PAXNEB protein
MRTVRQEIDRLLQSLPRNLHWDKFEEKSKNQPPQNPESVDFVTSQAMTGRVLQTLEEHGDENDDDDAVDQHDEEQVATNTDEHLKNAWQYRQNEMQNLGYQTSSGGSKKDVYCHSFDLQNGTLSDQLASRVENNIRIIPCGSLSETKSGNESPVSKLLSQSVAQGFRYFRILVNHLFPSSEPSTGNRRVTRIVFYRSNPCTLRTLLPLLQSYCRERQLPVVFLVSLQAWVDSATTADISAIQRACDVVLEVEGFASRQEYPPPAEFRDFHGLLKIRRMNTVTSATGHGTTAPSNLSSVSARSGAGHFADITDKKRPVAYTYGLKRDRRKLNIQLLHIPPEDFSAKGGSVGSSAPRAGAGRIGASTQAAEGTPRSSSTCGTNNVLEF